MDLNLLRRPRGESVLFRRRLEEETGAAFLWVEGKSAIAARRGKAMNNGVANNAKALREKPRSVGGLAKL